MRRLRLASQNNQRLTRSALAVNLGNPELIPDTLANPDFSVLDKKLPEVEELQKQALQNNVTIKSLHAQLQAARQAVAIARNSDNPILKGQMEAHAYSRETGSTDAWRAGVMLEIPLSKGGRTDASIAKQKANLYKVQSTLRKVEMEVQQQVLQLWLELEAMKIKRDEMMALTDYSELYLDKSRVLYEMEVQSTLGDAMITVTKAQYESLKADLDMTYAWAKMDALTGNMIKSGNMTKEH
jgi:outer membrane protein TolC